MINNNSTKSQLVDKVLNKIKLGRIKMKPKAHFILKTLLIVLGAIVLALFILYLISFITFALRASGVWFLPGFGFHGIGLLFTSMPWLLILAAICLIIVLEVLVNRFSFAYRRPVLYSVIAIVIFVFLGGLIIDKTHLHSGFFQRAQERRLPFAGEFYRSLGMPELRNINPGVVSEITDDGFRIETIKKQALQVIITSETRFPSGTGIKEGDRVIVLGQRDNSTIQASDVRKIDEDFGVFPRDRIFKPRNMLLPGKMPIMPGR